MPNSDQDNLVRGYLLAFLCSLLSALMIVLIKWVSRSMPTFSILFHSQVVAGAFLTAALIFTGSFRKLKRIPIRGWAWLAGIVVLTYFAYWTFFVAIKLLDPTVASFVGRAETLVTIFLGYVLFGERMTRREMIGAVMVLAGVLVIRFTAQIEVSRGLMFCLAAALLWGITEALAKLIVRFCEPFLFTWARSVILMPAFYLTAVQSQEGLVMPDTAGLWAGVIGLSMSGPVAARYLYMKSLTLIHVSKCALINQLQPVWVAAIACAWLGALPLPREWLGGLCIMSGCAMLVWMKKNSGRDRNIH